MNAYFISGMAADGRVFKDIKLPPAYKVNFLSWISPLTNESLSDYANRLAQKINTIEPFILIGLSMGGMMAVEIAKTLHPEKLILISSVPVATELPTLYKNLYNLKASKLLSVSFLKNASVLKKFFGGYSPEHRKLLISIIRESDSKMIKWAIQAVGEWNNKYYPAAYTHIHGDNDNVLPSKYTHPSYVVKGGRHFMVLERSAEINKILNEIL